MMKVSVISFFGLMKLILELVLLIPCHLVLMILKVTNIVITALNFSLSGRGSGPGFLYTKR